MTTSRIQGQQADAADNSDWLAVRAHQSAATPVRKGGLPEHCTIMRRQV
ncbi:hypothetical protein [Streptomyces sp. enrichment culture]